MSPTGRLEGKVAVITGATSGIGAATAYLFAREGAHVVAAGRSAERGAEVVGRCGPESRFQRCDVSSESDIESLVDFTTDTYGRIDCLFNNAGEAVPGDFASLTPDQFDHGMRLLVGSVLWGIKHAAPAMATQGSGVIINNSSIAALRTGQGGDLYSIAKAAVAHITRLAGAEYGYSGIRVNSISPGAVATPVFWGGLTGSGVAADDEVVRKQRKLEANLAAATPMQRSGLPEDIAHAALFLASDAGSFVNAHDLVVDGGRVATFAEPQPRPHHS